MPTVTERLQVIIDQHGAREVGNAMGKMGVQAGKADRSLGSATGSLRGFVAAALPLASGGALLAGLYNTNSEFQTLNARLKTVTGSQAAANQEFKALQAFASETPAQLSEWVDAFTRMESQGLNPSKRSLQAYGDIAAGMGKNLIQFVEAVADASVGEFERLKDFGIKASSQGDKVALNFKGQSTTIAKDADVIQEYLIRLGETDFAGAQTAQMNTLVGATSNAKDAIDALFYAIGESGASDFAVDGIRSVGDAIKELAKAVDSGQIGASVDALIGRFDGFGDDMSRSFDIVGNGLEGVGDQLGISGDDFDRWGDDATGAVEEVWRQIQLLPINVRYGIQRVVVELAAMVDAGGEYGEAFGKVFIEHISSTVDKAGIYARELKDLINPFDGDTFDHSAALADVDKNFAQMTASYLAAAEEQTNISREARLASIDFIQQERDAAFEAYDQQIEKALELRDILENEEAPEIGASTEDITPEEGGDDAKANKKLASRLGSLTNLLQTELELENQHYAESLSLLDEAERKKLDTVFSYQELRERLDESHAERLVEISKNGTDEMDEYAKQAARNMQDTFSDFLFDPFDNGVDGMLKSFSETLRRMVADALAAEILGAIGGAIGGGGGFVGAFGAAISGHKATGGPVAGGNLYEINERGVPEVLSVGGKDFLMMGRNHGQVTAPTSAPSGGGGGGSTTLVDSRDLGRQMASDPGVEQVVMDIWERNQRKMQRS